MRALSFVFFSAVLWSAATLPVPAAACGGFFCDSVTMEPVDQGGERIFFEVNEEQQTITTTVEVDYVGEAERFAWLVPLPEAIEVDDIEEASGVLFTDLEARTASAFQFPPCPSDWGGWSGGGWGCGPSTASSSSSTTVGDAGAPGARPGRTIVETVHGARVERSVGTERVLSAMEYGAVSSAAAVPVALFGCSKPPEGVNIEDKGKVGPFAIQIITLDGPGDAAALHGWLNENDFALPEEAIEPIAHYTDAGMAFMAVELQPDEEVSQGTLQALRFSYSGEMPMIPIILTGVAAVSDMPIVAYVLADEPFAPINFVELDFDWQRVEPSAGGTTFRELLERDLDEWGGQAVLTEFRGRTRDLMDGSLSESTEDTLRRGKWLTRFRASMSPDEMTLDPVWSKYDMAPAVDNLHVIEPICDDEEEWSATPSASPTPTFALYLPLAVPFAVMGWARRRRGANGMFGS